jgi:Raf kinase inhibitor-like YbhB/YbcL family protein
VISGHDVVLSLLVALLVASPPLAWADPARESTPPQRDAAAAARLTLQSPDISPGGRISLGQVYDGSGCHGGNVSPSLSWSHAPAGTRSFTVLMLDPDAPGGSWWHWAVFDIPAGAAALREGAGDPARHLLPSGATQVRNDFGSPGYGGPCPPPGPPHHYHVILYALRVAKLGLDGGASPAKVAALARGHAIAEAEIVALYGR